MEKRENIAQIFANNLKFYRLQLGLKQIDLAKKLNYSEKAISKWEKGNTLPPTQVILEICDVLGIDINSILDNTKEASYFLGIDGGATKTAFALADKEGNVINFIKLPHSNPFDIGFEKSAEVLQQGINEITKGISRRKISLFAGISGGISGNMQARFKEFFSKLGFLKAENGSDAHNIIKAGLGDKDGVAIIMGTGSSGFLQKDGALNRIGGFGYLFDGLGSGYDIGRDAIKYALADDNGIGEKTLITDLVKQKTNQNTVLGNLSYFYNIGKSGIASFCPLVFEAYAKGDKVAKQILCDNMKHIAYLIDSAYKIMNKHLDVVLVGGLTKQFDVLSPFLFEHLKEIGITENVTIKIFDNDVVYGALLNAGMKENPNFKINYQE